jgi:enterochelin esterase-like enzyme
MDISRAFSLMLVATSLLAACAPVETPIAPSPQVAATGAPSPSPTRLRMPTPTPTPLAVCQERVGQVMHGEIELPADTRPLAYRVYYPPCFDPARAAAYPTLYLMHGLAQSEAEWDDLGVAGKADILITQESVPAFVIVMPGERTGFDMLAAITDTLLPYLEQTLPTGGEPRLRAIGGLSRGAGWALRIGLQRPDLFGAIGLHSPAVISPDLYLLPTWAAEVSPALTPRLWLDVGTEDTLLPAALDLRARLDKLRWPYTWVQKHGEHTATYWSSQVSEYLRWYAEAWPAEESVR